MTASRPSVFIDSASEDLTIVRALGAALADRGAVVRDWKVQGNFPPGQNLLHSLLRLMRSIDFGICVAGPHDVVGSKGQTIAAPRDNVLLELGVLLGAIGSERTFVMVPRGVELKLPSDYEGITRLAYEPPGDGDVLADVISTLAGPVGQIWDAMQAQKAAVPSTVLGGHCIIGAHAGRFAARAGLMRVYPRPDPQMVEISFGAESGPVECGGSPRGVYAALIKCIREVLATDGDSPIENLVIALPGVVDAPGRRLRMSATALPPTSRWPPIWQRFF